KVLSGHGKIVMVVTHDPVLALMTDKRIVMKNGGMEKIVSTSPQEKFISKKLNKIDELMLHLREKVRRGELVEDLDIDFLELESSRKK
ncbi:MAG: ABC transporter ATP-binding protein, partial [Euryarchaeota archaeon]|nr:ABC transporter ATP-binding protein [Euryarchaeota archaeon]MBV1767026.1 ABC transporter ATP-binding protein [Methanobacterium sp.]